MALTISILAFAVSIAAATFTGIQASAQRESTRLQRQPVFNVSVEHSRRELTVRMKSGPPVNVVARLLDSSDNPLEWIQVAGTAGAATHIADLGAMDPGAVIVLKYEMKLNREQGGTIAIRLDAQTPRWWSRSKWSILEQVELRIPFVYFSGAH